MCQDMFAFGHYYVHVTGRTTRSGTVLSQRSVVGHYEVSEIEQTVMESELADVEHTVMIEVEHSLMTEVVHTVVIEVEHTVMIEVEQTLVTEVEHIVTTELEHTGMSEVEHTDVSVGHSYVAETCTEMTGADHSEVFEFAHTDYTEMTVVLCVGASEHSKSKVSVVVHRNDD